MADSYDTLCIYSKRNGDWYKFVAKVKERRTKLPESVESELDNHQRLHGW
jgi:hypothetical protein